MNVHIFGRPTKEQNDGNLIDRVRMYLLVKYDGHVRHGWYAVSCNPSTARQKLIGPVMPCRKRQAAKQQ